MTDLDTRHILPNSPVTQPRRAERPGLIERARCSPWAPMPVLVAAVALIVIDFFIVNVAIRSMQSQLHASAGAIEWVVAGYGLSFAVLLVTAGRLGDRFGRRRVLSAGMALFIAASTACGLAPDPPVLIAGRLLHQASAGSGSVISRRKRPRRQTHSASLSIPKRAVHLAAPPSSARAAMA